MTPSPLLEVALEAAGIARKLIQEGSPGTSTPKGDRDMATELDYRVERAIREFLGERTPDLGFRGEEEGSTGNTDGPTWLLDPIDGTVNLVHGLPLVGVSLALVDADQPMLGVIDLPFQQARYWAEEGHGAFLDGTPLRTSRAARLDEVIVAIGDFSVSANAAAKNRVRIALLERLAAKALRVRMLGSAATDLAWLAQGRLGASITLNNNPWDMAAGVVIAREAGAVVVDQDGAPYTLRSGTTIASAAALLESLLNVVQEAAEAGSLRA